MLEFHTGSFVIGRKVANFLHKEMDEDEKVKMIDDLVVERKAPRKRKVHGLSNKRALKKGSNN